MVHASREEMHSSLSQAEKAEEYSTKARENFEDISTTVSQMNSLIQNISSSATTECKTLGKVSENINLLRIESENITEMSHESEKRAQHMTKLSQQLSNLVSRFKT